MQNRFEALEASVMKGGEESTVKIIETPAELARDQRANLSRAQAHTRPQLEMLIHQLRKQRDRCHNKEVRGSLDDALEPLEARLDRYLTAERLAREREAARQRRKEEREFKEMMANWVQNVSGDVVEKNFTVVAEWQVENAHARDVARDKWRLRSQDRRLAAQVRRVPEGPLRWCARGLASAVAHTLLRCAPPAAAPLYSQRLADPTKVPLPGAACSERGASLSFYLNLSCFFFFARVVKARPRAPARGGRGRRAGERAGGRVLGVAGGGGRGSVRHVRG